MYPESSHGRGTRSCGARRCPLSARFQLTTASVGLARVKFELSATCRTCTGHRSRCPHCKSFELSTTWDSPALRSRFLRTVSQDSTTDETQLLQLAALDSGTEADDQDSPPGTPPSGDTLLLASLDSPVPVGEPEANPRALPQLRRAAGVSFTLGTMTAEETAHVINSAYNEAIHYRPNAFDVPRGSTPEAFVTQLSRYLHVFGNGGTYEDQALKIGMVYQLLLLQKPYQSPQSSYAKCLRRRMDPSQAGSIPELPRECQTVHQQLSKARQRQDRADTQPDIARDFASMVTRGKLKAALNILEDDTPGGVLDLDEKIGNDTVRDILISKHPDAQPAKPDALLEGDAPAPPHPIQFESLTREVV
eukprot:scpid33457/ scgid2782/ 